METTSNASASTTTTPDKIEKKIVLRASRDRVWRALTNANEFGTWFGVKLDGEFAPGKKMKGAITPTKVDPKVAEMQKPYEGKAFDIEVDQINPQDLFSFRWHPYAVEESTDYASEPMTLVTFALSDAEGGKAILLTVTESGFDKIPLKRRAEAFASNEGGWEAQTKLIEKYLAQQTA
jgi:uncharacterized protein YndB with AHSA1/START domain